MRKKILKATHQGKLNIGKIEISCAVLENGMRVLSERSVGNALGTKASATYWKKKKEGRSGIIPQYIAASNLRPFIDKELMKKFKESIIYIAKNGRLANGIYAEVLPDICHVWIEAREKGGITELQEKIVEKAYTLLRGFANVGIIALVDEATGYQEVRDRLALQEILEKYLTDEWAKWTKTFPDEFYKELFRLRRIDYPPRTSQKPMYIGHWTNDIIYTRLAPGILKELKVKNPRLPSGNRKRKHHQYFTRDIGHPELKQLLSNVIFLMRGCTTWQDFKRRLNRTRPKYGDTIPMDFDSK